MKYRLYKLEQASCEQKDTLMLELYRCIEKLMVRILSIDVSGRVRDVKAPVIPGHPERDVESFYNDWMDVEDFNRIYGIDGLYARNFTAKDDKAAIESVIVDIL